MPKIVSLKDNNSIIKYPATISDAVVDLGTGKKLSDIIDSLFDYLYFEAVLDSNISFTGADGLTIDLKYKIDNGKWLNYSSLITLAAGHKAYFKGDNERIVNFNDDSESKFSITGGVNVGGNIMSLLGFRNLLVGDGNGFIYLFHNCTGILSAENLKLPATTLASYCYEFMFFGCSSLTTPPSLPATTLTDYCYGSMFEGCTSLIKAPELPATTLADSCYIGMFLYCTSLTTSPQLPATTLANSCYKGMFYGCTSLTTPPELPATTLATKCYDSMFYGCTSLTIPPELPATTLANSCYLYMFNGCTSLEKAPELPATILTLDCYYEMFYSCSKLSYIKALFTTTPSASYTGNWVNGVAPSGTFIKSSEATWNVNGNNGVPANWVIYKSLPTSNQSKIYTNVLRKDTSYSSPYSKSYFYFGQLKLIDLLRPSYIKYRVIAYAPGNGNYMLDSIVEWDFGYNGIYKSYCIYNNLSSTSYYPFGYHTLYRSNTAAITLSDGSYFGFYFGTSNSYGQSASTVARTIEVEILECYNCEATLIDSLICLNDAADVPANFRLTSTSVAYNTTNFTAVNVSTATGLQEVGDANSDTVDYSIRTNSYSKPMTSALGYGYRLLFTSSDLLGWVPANNSTSSNATALRTPATDPIDPFGEIVYYSGSAAVAAGSRPSATSLWLQYTITLGYSFNTTGAALTLTSWKPIYVKCAPLTNGSAILQGYTLDLPTTEDGFIYIYLGVAYSATAFELVFNHPVYYYKNGAVRLWTNELDPLSLTINYVFIEGEEINIGELFGDRIEGYVRVSGISDPEMTYREYKRVSELSSVFSVFKPCLVGNNFTQQGTCGKILHVLDTLDWEHDVKGNVVSLDGSMGEVMICNTETIYVLLTVIEVNSVRYDTALYSKTPFEWNGYCAEEFKPMGIAPSYCVAHKDEDNVTRMHSVYNSNWNGSWSSPVDNEGKFVATDDGNGGIIETFDSSANVIGNASGKSSTNISLPVGEQYAMNLNDDTTKTVPYYNSHAWALEVMHVGLMLAEGGTFASHSVSLMGSGFSSNYAATAATYWDESNSDARNGFRYIKSDGTTWGYYSLGSNANFGNGATGDNLYKACMLNSWRTPWNIFEQQRVLMYAAANSIEELTWFAFEGNIYKYRSVEGFKGLSDGVMTAVVWKKVAAKLAASCVEPGTSNSVGGNRCEWLISSAVYRGVITDVSPSWWTSGLWMCQWGTDNTMHAYICKEQSKMVKSEQTSAVDEDVVLPHENAEGYLPLQTLNATNGYAKDRSEETIFWPSSTSTQTGGGLNTYVGGYKYLGGTRPAEGEKLSRGFRRGYRAYSSYLSPVFVCGINSPSYASSFIGFGTCCVIQT